MRHGKKADRRSAAAKKAHQTRRLRRELLELPEVRCMSELLQGRTGADAHNLIANNRKAGRAWFLATDAALRMLGTNPEHATGKVCGALGM